DDEDATIVSNYVVGQDAEVLIIVEYVTNVTSNVVYPVCVNEVNAVRTGVRSDDKGKAVVAITSDEESDGSDNDDSDDSDYSQLDVRFYDSEEERGLVVDDGFEAEVENVVEGQAEVVENVVGETSQVVGNIFEG
ncbi:hypothetical protein A2U01_0057335, partial [Trifolium medium]|nr:hypothetical protein [Trifolium medium]